MSKESLLRIIAEYLILFLACIFTFLFFRHVDISLWYHYNQPVYYNNLSASIIFGEPGNAAVLIANFIGQFMQNNSIGSLLLTFLIVLWIMAMRILIRTFAPSDRYLSLVILTVVPFLVAQAYYDYFLPITVSYIFTAITACLIIPAVKYLKPYLSILFFLICSLFTYLLWGSSGLLLITGISAAFFIARRKYYYLFLIFIPIGIPLICLSLFTDMSLQEAYMKDFIPRAYLYVPWCMKLLPVIILLILLLIHLLQKSFQRSIKWYRPVIINTMISGVMLGTVYVFSYNEIQRNLVLVDKLAYDQEWARVLRIAKNVDLTREREVQFQVNRALCHQGVLLENMFIYPQYFGADGLFLDKVTNGSIAMPTSDLYYDLAFCNGSRHWANEALIVYGPQPRILKRLISCYIISNQFELASEYLTLLESSGRYKEWTSKMRSYINCNECVNNSGEFSSLLKYKDMPDEYESLNYPRGNLQTLISAGEGFNNKMAVEYTVAYDLLVHNVKNVIADLKLLKVAGYKKLPRPVQEAILIYILKEQDFKVDLQGYSIDLDVQKDFNTFNRIFASVKGDKTKAIGMHNQFKNTYWYYNVYKSPITNGRKLKE